MEDRDSPNNDGRGRLEDDICCKKDNCNDAVMRNGSLKLGELEIFVHAERGVSFQPAAYLFFF